MMFNESGEIKRALKDKPITEKNVSNYVQKKTTYNL